MKTVNNFIAPVSPLRYPGGKRKLAHVVHQLLELDGGETELLIEPFAGGAAVAISFLQNTSARVLLADADPLVAGFWHTVFSDEAVYLAELVERTVPTLKQWQVLRSTDPQSNLARAYKCLFLNRTSFSGILNAEAGPIGGLAQKSQYGIGCRFNAPALAKNILQLSMYKERVSVQGGQDWRTTVSQVRRAVRGAHARSKIAWYLDPPFFEKADRLYNRFFGEADHKKLRREIDRLPGRFVLSYDDVPSARLMYRDHPGFMRINLAYNARIDRQERLVAGEMLVSDMITRLRLSGDLAPMGQLFVMPERGSGSHLTIRKLTEDELQATQAAQGGER